MRRVFLSTYTLRVRRERTRDYRILDFLEDPPFLQCCTDFFNGVSRQEVHNEVDQSVLGAPRVESSADAVWGLLSSGDYGYATDLVNVGTLEQSYQRSPQEAELFPFYFMIHAPRRNDRAILILQRQGRRGVKTPLSQALRARVREQYPGHLLEILPHVPTAVLQFLRDGQLRSMILTSFNMRQDLADRIGLRGFQDDHIRVRKRIRRKADRQSTLPRPGWLRELLEDLDF